MQNMSHLIHIQLNNITIHKQSKTQTQTIKSRHKSKYKFVFSFLFFVFFYKWSFGEKLSERTDRGVCDGFVAFNKHPDVNDFVIVSAFNRHLYGKTIREMKKNPICFSSQRIKSKQFIKNGKAIIASKTIIPTCANDIKFLLPNFNPRLPNFTIGKSYDKVNCFDDVGAKQTIIDILQTKLNDLGKAHDFMDDDYEQLKKKYVKLKKKQVKEMLSQKKQ